MLGGIATMVEKDLFYTCATLILIKTPIILKSIWIKSSVQSSSPKTR